MRILRKLSIGLIILALSGCAHTRIAIAPPPNLPPFPAVTFDAQGCLDVSEIDELRLFRDFDLPAYREKLQVWFEGAEEGLK